jgi:ribonuclease P protein component
MSSSGQENFPKTARLRKRPEFLRLSRTGRKDHSGNFVVVTKVNDTGQTRLGVTVSSKVGNAVVRNRVKRLVREFFRRHRRELVRGLDVLVIAKENAKDITFSRVVDELTKGLADRRSREGS